MMFLPTIMAIKIKGVTVNEGLENKYLAQLHETEPDFTTFFISLVLFRVIQVQRAP
jgi:hypothetical protein